LKQGHVAVPFLSRLGPQGKLLVVKQANGIDCPALMQECLRHRHVLQVLDAIVQGVAIHVANQPLRRHLPDYGPETRSGTIFHGRIGLSYLQHLKDLVLALFVLNRLSNLAYRFSPLAA
jgi:hypothetical protein